MCMDIDCEPLMGPGYTQKAPHSLLHKDESHLVNIFKN